ncbi:MAG TPA: glycosyltransferase family 2 protein [Patescibacteria group bacterium]|nr:glycosyltransferase family 2 protein [Patescibacteria group bacterium]
MRSIRRIFSPNLDTFVGFGMLWVILAYVALYDMKQIHGFVLGGFAAGYLSVLLPIWLVDGLKSSLEAMVPRRYKMAHEDLDKVTVIIACKDGESVIGKTLHSLLRKLTPEQVIVASNGSTDRTCEIARSFGVQVFDFHEPLGKVRAINSVLPMVKTPYVLLLDDDTLLAGATIPTGLLEKGYDAVAFRVFVKPETWVSFLQMHEYRKSFDVARLYHNKRASVQNISGAIGLFKLDMLIRQIRLHNGEFSGEDLQRTLLIHIEAGRSARGGRGVVLARSIVITQAPTTIPALFRQRTFGWFPGIYGNFPNYVRILCNRRQPAVLRFEAFYTCFLICVMDIFRLLSLPVMIFYPWYFLVMYCMYVLMELPPYARAGRVEPFWVVLLIPLYGVFGMLTRICASAVFVYRRLVFRFDTLVYFDDYRLASKRVKVLSSGIVLVVVAGFLGLNVLISYSSLITSLTVSF